MKKVYGVLAIVFLTALLVFLFELYGLIAGLMLLITYLYLWLWKR